ncbi:hypothetical protein [Nocardia sp. NPDC059228]|uniref:hypothetical protein n=1 Tax=Nocardia sp. NPDC059228 TaxID=3346777 RepID=UPI00367EC8E7
MNRPHHVDRDAAQPDRDTAIMFGWLLLALAIILLTALVGVEMTLGVGWLSVAVVVLAVVAFVVAIVMIGGRDL